jgi:hypothetical protein
MKRDSTEESALGTVAQFGRIRQSRLALLRGFAKNAADLVTVERELGEALYVMEGTYVR